MHIKKIILTSVLLVSSLFAGNYTIDKVHSSVGFKVKHMMISNVKGTFDNFKGSFEYDEKTNTLKSLNGEIEVASINTANEKRDKHLKADDIFAAKKYPKIIFKLNKIDGDTAYGELTMKGITKKVELEYEAGGTIINPWGKKVAGFSLYGKIKRSNFNIIWNKVLEAGGVAVSDTVKLEIEIEGVLAK